MIRHAVYFILAAEIDGIAVTPDVFTVLDDLTAPSFAKFIAARMLWHEAFGAGENEFMGQLANVKQCSLVCPHEGGVTIAITLERIAPDFRLSLERLNDKNYTIQTLLSGDDALLLAKFVFANWLHGGGPVPAPKQAWKHSYG